MKRIFTLFIFIFLSKAFSFAQTTPTAFTPGTATSSSLQFTWTGSATTDFYIVRNTSVTIGNLADGTSYAVNDPVAGGGTVVGITAGNTFTDNSLNPGTQYFYEIFDHKAPSGPKYSSGLAGTMTTAPAGTITPVGPLTALSTTYGTASSFTTFTVTGSNLGAAGTVLITPPSGFEVADGTILTYGATLSYTADGAGTLASKTVNVRLAATTVPATYSGNITLANAQTSTVNIATVSSTVNTKALTITGLTGTNKVYDRTNTASFTGTPTLNGINGSDVVTVGGSPSATFASVTVANGIIITVAGYATAGAQAAYYTITPPTTTANITPKALTISGITANDKPFDGTNAATLTGTPTLNGVVSPDVVTVSPSSPAGTFASSAVGTGIAVTVTPGSYVLGGADNANYTVSMPTGLTATITQLTTVTQVSGGVAVGPTINTNAGTVAVLGFSLNNPTNTGNLNSLTLTTTADPSTLFSSISLVSSADNTYDGADPAVTATVGTTSSTITFTGITGQTITAGGTTYYYFVKVTLKPFFSTVDPTIKISFDPATAAITFSNTIVGTGSVINTINGANTSYTLHDNIAPTITSITNNVSTIFQGALVQTVVVKFSETMTNSGFNPAISFSAGTWPAQAVGSWSQTTFTDDTYTTTFSHSAVTEETQANVTSSVSTMTAKDPSGNVVSNIFTSAGNFLLDNQRPTVTITQVAVSTGSFSRTTDNSVAYNIVFSEPLAPGTFTAADITLTSGGTSSSGNVLTNPLADNKTFLYTINSITGDGTLTITLGTGYTDVVGNAPAGTVGPSAGFTIDNTAPTVAITLVEASPSTASTLHFTVTFSESVTGVDISDFALTTGTNNDATGTILAPTGSGAVYTVTVNSIVADYGSGTQANLSLDMSGASGIADLATVPFGGSVTNTQYLVDDTPPTVESDDFTYNANGTGAETVVFTVSEPLNGASVTGFTIGGGTGTVNPTGAFNAVSNTITLTNAGADGTWPPTITVSYSPGNAQDLLGNPMAAISATAVSVPNVNLQAGDIAFTAYNSKPGPDGFSFVILKDLPALTKIFFTDNGWNGTALQTGEQTITWTSPNSVTSAGTEVKFIAGSTGTNATVSLGTYTSSSPTSAFDLHSVSGSSGDQLLAYQGSSGSPVFIAAINCSNDGSYTGNWCTNPGTDNNRSALPAGLTDGVNAISFSASPKDNIQYKSSAVTQEGSAQQLRSSMNAVANFNTQNNTAYTLTSGASVYKIRPVITAVTIPNSTNYIISGTPYTATITVHDDRGSAHTLLTSNIDGFSLSNLVRISSTSYTAQFTITNGVGTDVAAGTDIAISVDLQSAQGNSTAAVTPINTVAKFTTAISQNADPVDSHAPTISSITNTLSAIKVGALTQTVTVVYSESTTMNTSVQPAISLSGGSTHWGAQTPSGGTNGWVGNTYKATFTHDGTPEGPISVQSSVAVGGAQDALGNPNTGSSASTAFTLDTQVPTLAAANITFNKTSVNVSNTGAGSNTIRVTVQYGEKMKNTVAPTISFSSGTFGAGVPVTGGNSGWFTTTFTDDTYKADFTNSTTTEEFTGVTATVSGGQDFVGNIQSGSTISTATFSIDTKAPTVLSSNIVTTSPTNATSLDFLVTFSEPVSVIDVTDFALATTGSVAGTIASVNVTSGSSVTVTVNSITGDGTLGLDVKTKAAGATLQDAGTNPLTGGFTGGQTYIIDHTPPVVASIAISSTLKGIGITNGIIACPTCGNTSVKFLVTFTETNTPLTGIDPSDFTVGTTGTVSFSSPVVVAVTSASTRTVTINGISGYGKISLGLTDDNTILDAASNPLAGAADGSVPTSFTGTQYYTIVLPEPFIDNAFPASLSAPIITSNSITVTWTPNNTAQTPTHYLVLASTGTPTAPVDGTPVADGPLAQNIPFGTNSAVFNNLNSGTVYNFAVYKYTLSSNNTSDNIDFELTKPAVLNGSLTITAALSTATLISTAIPISSIKNASGNSVDVMQFTIFDEGQDPISPNVMALYNNGASPETIIFTLRDQLTLTNGSSVTGFTSSTGSIASAIFTSPNTITLTSASDNTWTSATTISYNAATGNAQFVTLGKMQAISLHAVFPADVVVVYNTPGSSSFIVPAGVTSLTVEAWGAGGSAGGYDATTYGGGSQGGGGGAYSSSAISVTPTSSYNVSVGAGGPSVTASACCTAGNPGGSSSFGPGLVSAQGGQGGENSAYFAFYGDTYDGVLYSSGHFGLGGAAASGIGTVRFSGGNGGNGGAKYTVDPLGIVPFTAGGTGPFPMLGYIGGSGGSSAGTSANGNNGSGPYSFQCFGCSWGNTGAPVGGGNGGSGNEGVVGGAGVLPGGGGGGTDVPSSGAGAGGQVRISYTIPFNSVPAAASDWLADNSPTKFSQLVIKQGTGNGITDWRTIIGGPGGAELSDGTNAVTGVVNATDGSDITFTTIINPSPAAATDVGFINDANLTASSKTYTLKVWLRNDLSNTLAATVDGLKLAFKVDPANITYDDITNSNQKSSRLVATQSILQSGAEQITVVASQLVYHQPGSATPTDTDPQAQIGVGIPFSFNVAGQDPEVYALDANNNLDLNYTSTNGNSGNISNPVQGFGQSVTSLPFTNGKLSLNPFSFSTGSPTILNTKIVVTGTGSPAVSAATSTDVWPVISSSTVVSAAAGGEPGTLSSLTTSLATAVSPELNAVSNFNFTVTDDVGANSTSFADNDGLPTQFNTIVISQGTGNDPIFSTDWSKAIAGAELSLTSRNGTVVSTPVNTQADVSVGTTSITFNNIAFGAGSPGHVNDGEFNIYTLKIFLKNPVDLTIADLIDQSDFVFSVSNGSFTPAGGANATSVIASTGPTESGDGNNTVKVTATKLAFTRQPASNQQYDAVISPFPVVRAQDVNGNLDKGYTGTPVLTTIPVTPHTYPILTNSGDLVNTGGIVTSDSLTSDPDGVALTVTSAGGGTNGNSVQFVVTGGLNDVGGAVTAATSGSFTMNYSGSSDIIKDPTFVHAGSAGNSYAPDILYANFQNASFTANTDGVALERFLIRDGGASLTDADGTATKLQAITLNISNFQYLRTVALYDGTTKIAERLVAGNMANIVGITGDLAFPALAAFQANDNSSKPLTIYATFIGNGVVDNQVVQVKVTSVTPAGVSSSFNVGGTSTNFATLTSPDNQIEVVATQLDFTTPVAPSPVSINTIVYPVIKARDTNANVDLDFTGASGKVTAFSNSASSPVVTMSNGPVAGTTQFALGVLDFAVAFPSFQFTTGDNNETFTVSITGTGGISGTSPTLTLKTNTITPGILTEPTTISSIATAAAGTNVFDFKVNDDDFLPSGGVDSNETLPTLISQIKITQLAGNDIADWRQLIASATLTDGVAGHTLTGVVNPANGTDITFSAINSSVGALGYIADNTSKTYTLNIVLLSSLGGSLPSTVDNLHLAFEVLAPNISIVSPGVGSSTFSTSENENSGATNNAIDVVATKLKWTTEPASSLLVSKDISLQQSPVPVIEAMDADNNRDLNYVTTLKITNTESLPMVSTLNSETSGIPPFVLSSDGASGTANGGRYTFPNDFQYDDVGTGATGNGTMTAVTSVANSVDNSNSERVSSVVTVKVGIASTITAGALAEPGIISSLVDLTHTPAGLKVFDFTINDDPTTPTATPANQDDGNPTRIQSITVNQGTSNGVTDWTEAFAKVQLSDGTTSYIGTINPTSLVFDGAIIPSYANAAHGDFGYIDDNTSKTYTLTVWLKTALGGTLPVDIDGKIFEFSVDATASSIVTDPHGTSIIPTENEDSGPANNVVTVVATQLDITTPATAISASLNVPITPIIAESRDVNGNRDLGFHGIITAFTKTTPADSTINRPTVGVSAFTNGVYTFPSTFTFITGTNGDNVALKLRADNTGGSTGVTCGGNAICSGISPTITLLTSFESFITKDPTFAVPATIPYVTHQETSPNLTGSSYELIRVLLLDGSRSSSATYGGQPLQFQTATDTDGQLHGDLDGANTNLSSITIRISNPSNLRTIGLFDKNGVQLGSQIDVAALGFTSGTPLTHDFTFTGSPVLFTAADDTSAVFSVRASFNNTSNTVKDGDDIQIQLISASIVPNSGSDFYNGTPANSAVFGTYPGGQLPGTPPALLLGLIDVMATSLDFTTQPSNNPPQPSIYAGINEPIGPSYTTAPLPSTAAGIVTARDIFAIVDTGFTPTSITLYDDAAFTANQANPPYSLIPPAGGLSFTSGVMNLDGMQYPVAVGNKGKITVRTTGTTGSSYENITGANGGNAIACSVVNVLDVSVSIDTNNGVLAGSGNPPAQPLKGGQQGLNIFGLKFTANSTAGTEPLLKSFIIKFKAGSTSVQNNWYEDTQNAIVVFSGFKVFINGTANNVTSFIPGSTVAKASSSANQYLDEIVVTLGTPQPISSGISFYLVADVDPSTNTSTQTLIPYFVDAGYGKLSDKNSIVSNGTSTGVMSNSTNPGEFDGAEFSFASTQPPTLRADIRQYPNTKTYPFAGQSNVDPGISQITLEFDTNVGVLDDLSANQYTGEIWNRGLNTKVADLILNTVVPVSPYLSPTIPAAQGFVSGSTLSNIYPKLVFDLVKKNSNPLGNDSVFYVKIRQGSYDPISGVGHGISDFGLNFFGGITDNSTLYFKVSSSAQINLNSVVSNFDTKSVGTLTTNYDQLGTSYYLILNGLVSTPGTGTITSTIISSSVTGVGTLFTTELAVGSILRTPSGSVIGTIASITSNTSLNLTASAAIALTSGAYEFEALATGTITSSLGSATITGSGTLFTTELAVGSILKTQAGAVIGTVASIASNTSLALAANASVALTSATYALPPVAPTQNEILGLSSYGGNGTVAALGSYPITAVNIGQTATFSANFSTNSSYDVYLFAKNNAQPTPIPAAKIYSFPALISGIPSTESSPTPNSKTYTLCPDSYVTITDPMIVGETSSSSFFGGGAQDFNVLLPTGFEFDVSVTPNIQLIGSDFSSAAIPSYLSNTLLNVKFTNSGSSSVDYIAISGISVIGKSGSSQGDIQWFYGNNMFTSTSTPFFPMAKISLQVPLIPDFTNSYWYNNQQIAPFPLVTSSASSNFNGAANTAFQKTVNAIPDDFNDPNNPKAIRLLPMTPPYSSGINDAFAAGDYLASFYSGTGVSGDLLTLNAVTAGAAFNIFIAHTDLNGCATSKKEQYVVYDHNSPISKKLGVTVNITNPSSPAGTKQDLVNSNFNTSLSGNRGSATPIVSPTLLYNELAGYSLLQLNADLPASEIALNSAGSSSQIISGTSWQNLVKNNLLNPPVIAPPGGNFNNYTWDYSNILNAPASVTGLANVYDYFKRLPSSGSGNSYWLGGSLGKIEYTGAYQSTADNTVYAPFRQDVELFVPAVPLIEVTSPSPFYDKTDVATTSNFNAVQYPSTNITGGYPGTATFCEKGGTISLSAYPVATSTSSGTFALYDYQSFKNSTGAARSGSITSTTTSTAVVGTGTKFKTSPADVAVGSILYDNSGTLIGTVQSIADDQHLTLTSLAAVAVSGAGYKSLNPLLPFVDNGNGTMTLDPTNVNVRNAYNNILVTYTYQDNNSPAVGVGYLVIRVTPNPVAGFNMSSTVAVSGATGASSFDALCVGSPITFDASSSSSTIAAPTDPNTPANYIKNYTWNFGDANSKAANAPVNGAPGSGSIGGGLNQPIPLSYGYVQPLPPSFIANGGFGYLDSQAGTPYPVSLTGGSGTGATANITVVNHTVVSVELTAPGSGYVAGDMLTSNQVPFDTQNVPLAQQQAFNIDYGKFVMTFDKPWHYYSAATADAQVKLDLVSNWGCPSLSNPINLTTNKPQTNLAGQFMNYPGSAADIMIGDTGKPDFTFTGNCASAPVTFTYLSSTQPTQGYVSAYNWDFNLTNVNSQPGAAQGFNSSNGPNNTYPVNVLFNAYAASASPNGNAEAFTYDNSGIYTARLTTITNLGCKVSVDKLLGQLKSYQPVIIDFTSDDGGFLSLDISTQGSSQTYLVDGQIDGSYVGKSSWQYDATAKNWSTTKAGGGYYQSENSALYAACLDLTVPRPMISFDLGVDINSGGDGLVLQYSSDSKNILDKTKTWNTLGADPITGAIIPGIEWYNANAIATSPGSYTLNNVPYAFNQKSLGWTGAGNIFQPKHALDNSVSDLTQLSQPLQLRYVFASAANTPLTGVTIDNIRFGSRTRTILFENFTTTNAGTNTILNGDIASDAAAISAFVQTNITSTQLVNINYHVGFLGNDPFNLVNPADPSSRALYYHVNKVPYAFLDGKHSTNTLASPASDSSLFKNWGQAAYDLQTLKLAKADFSGTTVTPSNVDGSIQVDVNVKPILDLPASTILQVLVLEDSIELPNPKVPQAQVTTGETHFEYVLRKMIPDAVGTKFPAGTLLTNTAVHLGPATGAASPLGTVNTADKFNWVIEKPFDIYKYTVVVFLQDEVTKEVYQADLFQITPPVSTVTGVEPLAIDKIKVYPNPSDQELTIELPSPAQQSMKLTVANQLGQFTDMGVISEGEQIKKISTQGLAEGVYILQLGSNGNALRTKVVVVHK